MKRRTWESGSGFEQRRRRNKRGYKKGKTWYMLLNAFFSTVLFVLALRFIIQPNFDGAEKVWGIFMPIGYLFFLCVYAIVTSVIGSFLARIMTGYAALHSLAAYTQNILYSLIYAILIYVGILNIVFANTDEWISLFINLLALKIFVGMLANVLSAKIVGLR